jgi:hypothetical protein
MGEKDLEKPPRGGSDISGTRDIDPNIAAGNTSKSERWRMREGREDVWDQFSDIICYSSSRKDPVQLT